MSPFFEKQSQVSQLGLNENRIDDLLTHRLVAQTGY